jgi:hypothetical protein
MAPGQTQISAFVSGSTKERLERYAEAHGMKKAHLVEEALLHHLQALHELPADVIIPPRLVVDRKSGERILQLIERPRRPNKAMRDLFKK